MAATALQQAALLHFLSLLLFLQLHVLRVLEVVAHHRVPARKQVEADNTGVQCELCAIM